MKYSDKKEAEREWPRYRRKSHEKEAISIKSSERNRRPQKLLDK